MLEVKKKKAYAILATLFIFKVLYFRYTITFVVYLFPLIIVGNEISSELLDYTN